MSIVCSKCGADNNDLARYCDQCAAPISPEASVEAAAKAAAEPKPAGNAATINWIAIITVAVVVAVLGWLLFSPHKPAPESMAGAGAMAGGGDMQNPHTQGGAAADGGAMNADVMQQLGDAKAALEKDPLAVDSLNVLYNMYATIGLQEKVRPYLNKAYDALVAKRGELGDKATDTLIQLVTAAMMGSDTDGALDVLTKYQKLEPENVSLMGILGDVCFDTGKNEDAIKWYTMYLDKAKPEEAGETYWRVRTDRATMYLNLGKPVDGKDSVQLAVSELETVTAQTPGLWAGWFNLGIAYSTAGQKEKAKQAWKKALELASGELEKWQVEAQIAKSEGKEPPPPPENPHGDMGMGGAGMANPHGGAGGGEGMANPHGDMGAGDGAANPHGGGGAGNPHGGAGESGA